MSQPSPGQLAVHVWNDFAYCLGGETDICCTLNLKNSVKLNPPGNEQIYPTKREKEPSTSKQKCLFFFRGFFRRRVEYIIFKINPKWISVKGWFPSFTLDSTQIFSENSNHPPWLLPWRMG